MKNTPLLLTILDGWGVAHPGRGNAIHSARTPVFDYLTQHYWSATIQASGESVGLPWGETGNSEVGHLTLGSGRILYQDLPRITRSISDNSFFTNSALVTAIDSVLKKGGTLHLAGILSNGGVHGHIDHLEALLELCVQKKVERIVIHAFLDGRDVPYNSAEGFITRIEKKIASLTVPARIATISGRYFAMDRDNRWDRVLRAYQAIAFGESKATFKSAREAVAAYYQKEIFDEHIVPTVIGEARPVEKNDAIIFFNYRPDRMRELVAAFAHPHFTEFDRRNWIKDLSVVTMASYDAALPVKVAFLPEFPASTLTSVFAKANVKQLHIAETEKYAHVTYFFNGGHEDTIENEDRVLIPSNREVKSYAELPAMGSPDIATQLITALNEGTYGFVVANFANADMVGHTGKLQETIKAVEILDGLLKGVVEAVLQKNGVVVITADHGNAEVMVNEQTGEPHKEHTANTVPLIIIGKEFAQEKPTPPDLSIAIPKGFAADVAPTILKIVDLPIPPEMTGRSLV